MSTVVSCQKWNLLALLWAFIACKLAFGVCLLGACGNPLPPQRLVQPAFYYWKTVFQLSAAEIRCLDSLGCHKLYVKFLDIAKDPVTGEIRPYALLEVADTTGLSTRIIVPTVFITNSVFQNCPPEKTDWLARKTATALHSVSRQFPGTTFQIGKGIGENEIQFDCDWTPGTRVAFFGFLQKIRAYLPENTRLSATIRLHQYKFPQQTGTPPVERGMLMCYNTGELDNWQEANSIFQPSAAEKYLLGAPSHYPLPLDVALPIFSWALVFRDGVFWKIIPGLVAADFSDTLRFASLRRPDYQTSKYNAQLSASSCQVYVRSGTFLGGHYLRRGDRVRVETISAELLQQAAACAAKTALAEQTTVAFYDLDTAILRRYPVQLLDAVCKKFVLPEN